MKLAKLSLAAIVVAGLTSSSFAADTLADAFKNGKVGGELRAWYFDRDNGTTAHESIINGGISLNYVTDSFYGFRLGATVQSNYTPFADDAEKNLYKGDMYGNGAIFSEAYLGYAIGKTDIKIGRQYITSPLVSGSGSRMIKESFEGAVITNTDLPQTTLVAGYVDKFEGRTSTLASSEVGSVGKFTNTFALSTGKGAAISKATIDGAYTAAVINKSINGLTLTGQYAFANDVANVGDVSLYHAEANYVLPMNGFKLGFDANFRGSKTGNKLDGLDLEGHYLAARISVSELAGFGASFAAATTDNTDKTIQGMGNGPTSYTSTFIRGTSTRMGANTDSYLFAATYDFSKVGVAGLTALAQYGWTEQGTVANVKGTDYTNKIAGVVYAVPAVKGLTTSLHYETQEADNKQTTVKTDTDELWFKAGYKF